MSINIFINPTRDKDVALGACDRVPATAIPDWAMKVAEGKTAAAAFLHTAIDGDSDSGDIDALDRAVRRRHEYNSRIEALIASGNPVEMRIGEIDGSTVEAVPLDAALMAYGAKYVMPLADYNRDYRQSYGDLREGTNVRGAIVSRSGSTLTWRFIEKVSREQALADAADYSMRRRRRRIFRELELQAGRVFLQCRITGSGTFDTDKGSSEHYFVEFQGLDRFCSPYCNDIERALEMTDGTILLYLHSARRREEYILRLTTTWGRVQDLPYSPPGGFGTQRISSVAGRPYRFNYRKNFITVIMDDGTWQTGVFANRLLGNPTAPGLEQYPELAYRHIVPGYPCIFGLQVAKDSDSKSRLLLSGLAPGLNGRVRSAIGLSELCAGHIATAEKLAPAGMCDGLIRMVSANYTAYMPLGDAPVALRRMARAGIFSPDFKLPCDIRVTGERGYWQVMCRPAWPAASMPEPGTSVQATVHAALDGVLYLLADGWPATATVDDLDTELAILGGLGAVEWEVDSVDPTGSLTLRHIIEARSLDPEMRIAFGDIFAAGPDMTYHGLRVVNLPGGEAVADGTPMVCLRAGILDGTLVATSGIGALNQRRLERSERMSMLSEGFPYGLLIGRRSADGKLLSDSLTKPAERVILPRLADLYGSDATFVGEQFGNFRDFQMRWTGIACQHDYSALLGNIPAEVAGLWDGLDDDTPVLFGDICLCRRDIPGLADIVEEPEPVQPALDRTQGLYKVTAVDPAVLSVTFELDGHRVTLSGGEQLRLPFPRGKRAGTMTPLGCIFAVGSAWAIDREGYCLASDDSDTPRVYTLVAPLQQTAGSDWVVRCDDGSIAVASDLDDVVAGRRMLMTTDNVLGPYVYVEEAEEHFVGRKLRLTVERVTDTALECRELTGSVTRRIELPLGLVSWNPRWTPRLILPGTVLRARVIEARPDCLVVDRRCLIRQDALIPGIRPENRRAYQMEVIAAGPAGYRLSQNGVEALLPLRRAALFEITPRNLSYLRVDDLVTVALTRHGGKADWLTGKTDIARAWAASAEMPTFTVHHHCPDGLFVERQGIVMYVSGRALGHWLGTDLSRDYAVGSVIPFKVIETAPDRFELRPVTVPPLRVAAPAVGLACEVQVTALLTGVGCYVKHTDGWTAFVPVTRVSRLPLLADGHLPVEVGDTVPMVVSSVSPDAGEIVGDIAAAQSAPVVGPGSAEPFVCTVSGVIDRSDTRIVLVDNRGFLATIEYDSADTPTQIDATVKGLYAVLVTGMRPDGTMAASAAALKAANAALAERYKASPDNFTLEATVIGHGKKGIYLSHGIALGRMLRAECDLDPTQTMRGRYPLGSKVEVQVYSLGYEYVFMASVRRLRQRAAAAAAARYKPGDTLRMRIMAVDTDGVHGRLDDIDILVPVAEVCLAAGVTLADWAASRTLVDVEVIEGGGDGVLLASRRRYLGDIPER